MKTLVSAVSAFLLPLTVTASSRAEDATALAIIDKAIAAHGGLENLLKTQKMSRQATGKMLFYGQQVPFTDEMTLDLPKRSRWTLEGGPEGQKTRFMVIYDGQKGWQSGSGKTVPLDKDRLQQVRNELYLYWVASLVPLKTEKTFNFTTLPDSKVNERDAAAILVSRYGNNDLKLFFDKASGLLVKIEQRTKELGVPAEKEYFYSDHRMIDGARLPSKYIEQSNQRRIVDITSISYRFLPAVDNSFFKKPE